MLQFICLCVITCVFVGVCRFSRCELGGTTRLPHGRSHIHSPRGAHCSVSAIPLLNTVCLVFECAYMCVCVCICVEVCLCEGMCMHGCICVEVCLCEGMCMHGCICVEVCVLVCEPE